MAGLKPKVDSVGILLKSLSRAGAGLRVLEDSNLVVIVNGGAIGDTILFLDALDEMSSFFKQQGKKVLMICRPAIHSFVTAIRPGLEVELLSFPFERFLTDYQFYQEVSGQLQTFSGAFLIVHHPSKFADFISLNIPAKRKLQVKPFPVARAFNPYEWINRLCYNETLPVDVSVMALERYAALLHQIGVTGFQSKIRLLPLGKGCVKTDSSSPYCVIAPTTSEEAKGWGLEKFCSVIDHILSHSALNIYVCAGKEGDGLYEKICASVSRPERIVDFIDKTTFSEWVDLIRNAEFCFGNDSAAIHIAAHTATPSVTVVSGFGYQYCQPYHYEKKSDNDAVPVCVYSFKDCFGCYHKNLSRYAGNSACRKNVKNGGKYLCIQDVSVEQVLPEINKLLEKIQKETDGE